MKKYDALALISAEFDRATQLHDPHLSAHESYAVLLEQVETLWKEIKKKEMNRENWRLEKEAKQVGAMAMRFLTDVCPACS